MTESIAVLSDVQGNVTAFDAVLADIDSRGIQRIFNLGDLAGKGPRGSEAIARTIERCEGTVMGNWDYALARDLPSNSSAGMIWWQSELSLADRNWLSHLPLHIDVRLGSSQVRMVHASAIGVYHRVWANPPDDEFKKMFLKTPATGDSPLPDVVLYGDIHYAYHEVRFGKTLINVGSVGNSLDETTACYAIVSADPEFRCELVRVPYDIEAELAIAREMEMPEYEEYAVELRTAEYRGEWRKRMAGKS